MNIGNERPVNCFSRFVLDIGGKKRIVPVPGGMTKEKMNKCLAVCRAYLYQCVYVEIVFAECFMQAIEASVQRKKCFRFGVKKKWTDCKRNLRACIKLYDEYAPNGEDYSEEFAITFYEKTNKDLFRLRDKLAERLQRFGCGEMSGLYSNAIVLYNLTSMCLGTYEAIASKLYELLRVNMLEVYQEFCPVVAFENSYDFMKIVMGKDFERLSDKAVSKDLIPFFDKVKCGIFDEKTLDEAAKNASEVLDDSAKELLGNFVDVENFMDKDFKLQKSVKDK